LDFNGKHPNKQDPRNWRACQQYCKKDGDYITSEERNEEENEDILAKCKDTQSKEDWVCYCITNKIAYAYAFWLWDHCHQDDTTLLTNESDGNKIYSI